MWNETPSEHFVARHEDRDTEDAEGVLELLEATRARLARAFAVVPAGVDVVLHGSDVQLLVARPGVVLERVLAAPAARRYVTGTWSRRELHVLAPRRLEERASAVPGSRELVLLSPAGLYSRLVVGSSSRALRSRRRARRLAWLAWGAAEWFSGQTAHARPAIARRLREGRPPARRGPARPPAPPPRGPPPRPRRPPPPPLAGGGPGGGRGGAARRQRRA